jgi:hypothetical protein
VIARPAFIVAVFLVTGAILVNKGIAPARAAAPPAARSKDEPKPVAPRLVWKTLGSQGDGTIVAVEVLGIDPSSATALKSPRMTLERWSSFLTVRVAGEVPDETKTPPPLWGTYVVEAEALRFQPRFPLEPGIRYRAEFDRSKFQAVVRALSQAGGAAETEPPSSTKLVAEFAVPKRPERATTTVTAVYPSREMLPENLLRFYIHFSAPMSRGEAYHRIKLLNGTGTPVADPFLELAEELWSTDGTRFTLLFDPGRVKRGLKPREEVGPVLEAGKTYCLVIDRDWPDARRNRLRAEFRKPFRVGPPDDSSPDPKRWSIRPPRVETRDSLEVDFPEPLDRALLDRLITVHDAKGTVVSGQVSIAQEESRWRFTPRSPWGSGNYRLVVGTDLEDVSGNSIARPFEVDVTRPISVRVRTETVALPFRIEGRGR